MRSRKRAMRGSSAGMPASFRAKYAFTDALTSDGPFDIDIEAAVANWRVENRARGLIDQRPGFRLPDAILRRI